MPICPLISLCSYKFACLTADGLLLMTHAAVQVGFCLHMIGHILRNHFEITVCGLMSYLDLLPFARGIVSRTWIIHDFLFWYVNDRSVC